MRSYRTVTIIVALGLLLGTQVWAGKGSGGQSSGEKGGHGQGKMTMEQTQTKQMKKLKAGEMNQERVREKEMVQSKDKEQLKELVQQ